MDVQPQHLTPELRRLREIAQTSATQSTNFDDALASITTRFEIDLKF